MRQLRPFLLLFLAFASPLLAPAVARYQGLSTTVDDVRSRLGSGELLDIRYESFTEDTEHHLRDLCRFLGVTPSPDYLRACAALVKPTHSRSRDRLPWSADERREVEALIQRRPVLAGYSFDT